MPFPRMTTWRAHRAVEHIGVAVAYFLLAIALTYPVVLAARHSIPMDPQIEGWYPGDGDPWHYLWGFWLVERAFATFPPELLWTDLVFFPLGFEIPFLPGVGLILGPAAVLSSIFGVVLTYNLLWWSSFALAGYAMYLFSRDLFGDRAVAFACGCLFAFSTYRMIHAVEHLPILMASFLVPLFALALFRAARQPTTGRCGLCALVLAASTGISWYTTILLVVFLVIAGVVALGQRGAGALRAIPLVPALAGLVVLGLATSPFVLPLLLSPGRDSIVNRPLAESSKYSADLLAFFVPSPRNPAFGKLTGPLYERFTGNPYEQTVYLGYVLLGLAVMGALSGARAKTRLFRVSAAAAFALALGPFLHVAGRSTFPIEDHVVSVPLPYLLLHYIPFVRGARVPSRFTELLVLSLIVLAGYGLVRVCARFTTSRKALLLGLLLALATVETTLVPLPVVSARAPGIYAEIRRSPEMSTVLELPLDTRIIKYHYYQTVHGKRMIVGNPVRPREKYAGYPAGIPLMPLLHDPKLLLATADPPEARRDAERLAAFFEVRHVVIHGELLEPRVVERLDRFVGDNFPHAWRRAEGGVITYGLRALDPARAQWPERYVVDFGVPRREFALLTGWAGPEQWDGLTMQWSNDRESSLMLYLGEPAERLLEARLRPLVYPGSPLQTVSVYVNGTLRDRLVLTPAWAVYRVSLPAAVFRSGRNTLTFEYSHAAVPARAFSGSSDTRTLAVAFDYVALTPAR